MRLAAGKQVFRVEESQERGSGRMVVVDGRPFRVEVLRELGKSPMDLLVRAGARVLRITVENRELEDWYSVRLNGKLFRTRLELFENVRPADLLFPSLTGPIVVSAPMAGRIASLRSSVGTAVEEGQALVILEAMKMENEVASPKKGLVREIYVQPGALVRAGDRLVLVD